MDAKCEKQVSGGPSCSVSFKIVCSKGNIMLLFIHAVMLLFVAYISRNGRQHDV